MDASKIWCPTSGWTWFAPINLNTATGTPWKAKLWSRGSKLISNIRNISRMTRVTGLLIGSSYSYLLVLSGSRNYWTSIKNSKQTLGIRLFLNNRHTLFKPNSATLRCQHKLWTLRSQIQPLSIILAWCQLWRILRRISLKLSSRSSWSRWTSQRRSHLIFLWLIRTRSLDSVNREYHLPQDTHRTLWKYKIITTPNIERELQVNREIPHKRLYPD